MFFLLLDVQTGIHQFAFALTACARHPFHCSLAALAHTTDTLESPIEPSETACGVGLVLHGALIGPEICVPYRIICRVARETQQGARRRGEMGERGAVGENNALREFWDDGVGDNGVPALPDVCPTIGRRRDEPPLNERGGLHDGHENARLHNWYFHYCDRAWASFWHPSDCRFNRSLTDSLRK